MTRVFNIPAEELPNPSHRLVLVILADHANQDGECWPKNSTVAAKAGLSVDRTKVIIRELERDRWLERGQQRKRPDGSLGSRMMRLTVVPTLETGGVPTTPPSGTGGVPTTPCPPGEGGAHNPPGGVPTTPHEPSVEPSETIEPSESRESGEIEPAPDPRVTQLCELLADSMLSRPTVTKKPQITKSWLADMDKLIRIDGRDPDDIERVIRWLDTTPDETSTFWAPNVRSPRKLREKWDQMAEQVHAARQRRNGSARGEEWQQSLLNAAEKLGSELDVG